MVTKTTPKQWQTKKKQSSFWGAQLHYAPGRNHRLICLIAPRLCSPCRACRNRLPPPRSPTRNRCHGSFVTGKWLGACYAQRFQLNYIYQWDWLKGKFRGNCLFFLASKRVFPLKKFWDLADIPLLHMVMPYLDIPSPSAWPSVQGAIAITTGLTWSQAKHYRRFCKFPFLIFLSWINAGHMFVGLSQWIGLK